MNKDAIAISEIIRKSAIIVKNKITTEEYNLLMNYASEFITLSDNVSDEKHTPVIFKDDMQAGYIFSESIITSKDIKELMSYIKIAENKLYTDLIDYNYKPTEKIIKFKERKKRHLKKVD